jgi:hypothetical protein
MLGHGYHETQEPIANVWPVGTGGFSLHADEGATGYTYAVTADGRAHCDQVNVQWSCGDVTPAGGGFAYVPGSHKVGGLPPKARAGPLFNATTACSDETNLVQGWPKLWANFKALIGIFSQIVGPSLAIWTNPV